MLEKHEGAIKNKQFREVGNIVTHNTQDEDKQNKDTTQKTKIISNTDPTTKLG